MLPISAAACRSALAAWVLATVCAGGHADEARAGLPEVLDLEQTAILLRVAAQPLAEMAERGQIPARRVLGEWRFSRAALLRWLEGDAWIGNLGATNPRDAAVTDAAAALPSELGARIRGRGAAGAAAVAAPVAASVSSPAAETASTPASDVGEKSGVDSADRIALQDQRVLLAAGERRLDLGLSLARSQTGVDGLTRAETSLDSLGASFRLGLREDLQLTASVAASRRRVANHADASLASPAANSSQAWIGDSQWSLLGVAQHEASGRPNIIWSASLLAPTGPGDRGIGGGLVFAKSYDPAVLFAGFSFLRGLAIDASDSRRVLARNNFGLNLGWTFAINDRLAFNTLLVSSWRDAQPDSPGGLVPAREQSWLQLGMTWLLTPTLSVEPLLGVRIGAEHPDMSLSVNLPMRF